ncbi:MAG: thiamine pyrophosphate-binding protein [Gammaproteobacteria bacterium]|nr:thiamine pyrophosphate-binding protein [Gammaproteobacteria bacterium]
MNISAYLLERLKSLGVDHVFGIPGDYVLRFFEALVKSDVEHVATCNELNAGYAADGYARLKGLGAVAVTYGPGSLSLVNAVAGACAERVPVVVICGGPRTEAYRSQPYQHHLLPGNIAASLKIFDEITVAARLVDDPDRAPKDIDELLGICVAESRPVYLEIPMDLQQHDCAPPGDWPTSARLHADVSATAKAVARVVDRIGVAERCVLLVGHEIAAARLEGKVCKLIDKTGLPVASLYSGKPDFLEQHPRCIGIYQGLGSQAAVREFVEQADAVIWLGAVPSDFNLGGMPDRLTREQMISIFDGRVSLDGQSFVHVPIADMVAGLVDALPADCGADMQAPVHEFAHRASQAYAPVTDAPLSNKRFYDRLAHFIRAGDIVCADGGPSLSLAYVQFPVGARYVASAYWSAIGAGFGFAVGACFAAEPGQRIIAVEGDGSLQMTAQELATLIRYGKNCIIFVVNNRGYTVERIIHDGPFNDISDWQYHRLPEAFGGRRGVEVRTEGELEAALERADAHTGPGPLLIEVHLDPWDVPEAFKQMGAHMGRR